MLRKLDQGRCIDITHTLTVYPSHNREDASELNHGLDNFGFGRETREHRAHNERCSIGDVESDWQTEKYRALNLYIYTLTNGWPDSEDWIEDKNWSLVEVPDN